MHDFDEIIDNVVGDLIDDVTDYATDDVTDYIPDEGLLRGPTLRGQLLERPAQRFRRLALRQRTEIRRKLSQRSGTNICTLTAFTAIFDDFWRFSIFNFWRFFGDFVALVWAKIFLTSNIGSRSVALPTSSIGPML
jgi:hypothetical protein